MKRYYIPAHAHAKAIAHHMKTHESKTYLLDERNGVHGGLVRTLDRKKPVAGLRVFFVRHTAEGHRSFSGRLCFERTF